MPRIANFHLIENNIHAHSETFEFQHKFFINKKEGRFRFIASATHSKAPSYADGLKAIANSNTLLLNVIEGNTENNQYGGSKYSLGLNIEQELSDEIGLFSRAGWNDGKYASWAFKEIDRTANIGLSTKSNRWKRPNDVMEL